jgi:hypothetical protein
MVFDIGTELQQIIDVISESQFKPDEVQAFTQSIISSIDA